MDNCAEALNRVKVHNVAMINGQPVSSERFMNLISEFRGRLYDDLKRPYFLVLNGREKELFEPASPLFGSNVFDKFTDARDDIEEAGKCLALSRNKATVCHVMLEHRAFNRGHIRRA